MSNPRCTMPTAEPTADCTTRARRCVKWSTPIRLGQVEYGSGHVHTCGEHGRQLVVAGAECQHITECTLGRASLCMLVGEVTVEAETVS